MLETCQVFSNKPPQSIQQGKRKIRMEKKFQHTKRSLHDVLLVLLLLLLFWFVSSNSYLAECFGAFKCKHIIKLQHRFVMMMIFWMAFNAIRSVFGNFLHSTIPGQSELEIECQTKRLTAISANKTLPTIFDLSLYSHVTERMRRRANETWIDSLHYANILHFPNWNRWREIFRDCPTPHQTI